MTLIMTLLAFLLVLSFLVLIHELGHLVSALYYRVKVDEFGIGFPPRAMRLFVWKGIEFTLNKLPFGGFVRMAGEDGDYEGERQVEQKEIRKVAKVKAGDEWGMFYSKRKHQRIVVLAAGAITNFVFGIVAFSIVYSVVGIPQQLEGIIVGEVQENSPAVDAGLVVGDVVVGVVEGDAVVDLGNVEEMMGKLKEMQGQEIELVLERDGGEERARVYVREDKEIPEGQGSIGVKISDWVEWYKPIWWQRPVLGAWEGLKAAVAFGMMLVVGIAKMLGDLFMGSVPSEVSGPLGIVYSANNEGIMQDGWLAVVHFAGVLSINLAIVNMLPIPALDGGRIMFVLLEKVLGNKFKPIYEHNANLFGFILLLTLIVMVSLKDVGVILKDYGLGLGSVISLIQRVGS